MQNISAPLLHLWCLIICPWVFVFDRSGICWFHRQRRQFGRDVSAIWLSVKMRDNVWKNSLLCFTSVRVKRSAVSLCESLNFLPSLARSVFSPSPSLSKLCGLLFQRFEKLSLARVGWKLSGGCGGGGGALGRGSEWRLAPLSSCPDLHHVWLSLPVSIFSSLLLSCCEITHRHKFLHLE